MKVKIAQYLGKVLGVIGGFLISLFFLYAILFAAQDSQKDVLSDPVAFGAWLYKDHCVRCHRPYETERLASNYDEEELKSAIEKGGCRVDWSRRYGGKLNNREIKSLVSFMMAWEDLNGPPPLPELPPIPGPDIPPPTTAPKKKAAKTEDAAPEDQLDKTLKALMEINPAANGAYLYVQNCYRCHLTYQKARIGRGVATDTLKRTIVNGKTSTQMTPFSRMKGGNLRNKDIDNIVTYITAWENLGAPLALPAGLLKAPEADPAALIPIGLPKFPPIQGDAHQGARLYARYCGRCHGLTGQGYIGPRLAKTWWSLRPDLTIKSFIKQGIPESVMPAWSQNAGGSLSAKDIEDLVTHVINWVKLKSGA
jgi:mono/diheme cytochrome c family protein